MDQEEYEYANRISKNLNITYYEAEVSMKKYLPLFQNGDLETSMKYANDLCDWILSKNLSENCNKWHRYSCFKYHVGYIDSEIYQNIMPLAAERLTS